jgi:hypothetical protein
MKDKVPEPKTSEEATICNSGVCFLVRTEQNSIRKLIDVMLGRISKLEQQVNNPEDVKKVYGPVEMPANKHDMEFNVLKELFEENPLPDFNGLKKLISEK